MPVARRLVKVVSSIPAIYLFVALFFLRGMLLEPGMITNVDWGQPGTSFQAGNLARAVLLAWGDIPNSAFGDPLVFSHHSLSFLPMWAISAFLNIQGDVFTKALAVFLLWIQGLGMFGLCRGMKLDRPAAFVGGLLYMSLPPFFDWLSLGWTSALLGFGCSRWPFCITIYTYKMAEVESQEVV